MKRTPPPSTSTSPDPLEELFGSRPSSGARLQEQQLSAVSTEEELAIETELRDALRVLRELQELSTGVASNLESSADELQNKTEGAATTAERTAMKLKTVWFPSSAGNAALSGLRSAISASISSKDLSALAASIRQLVKDTDAQLKLVTALYERLAEIRKANQSKGEADFRREIEALREQLDSAVRKMDESREKLEVANGQIIKLSGQLRASQTETAEVRRDLEQERLARRAVEDELAALRQQLVAEQLARQNAERERNEEHQARVSVEDERNIARRELHAAHQRIAGITNERDALQRNLQEAHQQTARLTDERDIARRELHAAHQQITRLTDERDAARGELHTAHQQITRLTDESGAVRGELQIAQQQIARLTDERDVAQRELQTAHQQIATLTDERDVARRALQEAQLQIVDLTGQLQAAQRNAEEQQRRSAAREAAIRAAATGVGQALNRQMREREAQNRQFNELYDALIVTEEAANIQINAFGILVHQIASAGRTNKDEEKRRALEFIRIQADVNKAAEDLDEALQNIGGFLEGPAAANMLQQDDVTRARRLIAESRNIYQETLRTAALAEEHKNKHESMLKRLTRS